MRLDAANSVLKHFELGLPVGSAGMVALASVLCCAASAPARQDELTATPTAVSPIPAAQDQSASPKQFRPPPLHIDVAIPGELTSAEVDRWIEVLRLNEAAAAAVRETAKEYLAAQARAYGEVFGATYQQAAEIAISGGQDASSAALDRFRTLLEERRSALRRFVAMEERLFSQIASRLPTSEDVAVVDAMRQLRRRSRSSAFPCDLPMADLDLRALATATGAARAVAPADQDRWRITLLGYDTELATLHEKRVERRLESVLQDAESVLRLGHGSLALMDDRTARLAGKLKPERAIIAANRRWADALAALLPTDAADSFRSAVKATLFPRLHPNPYELSPIVRSVQALAKTGSVSEKLQGVADGLAAEAAKVDLLAEQLEVTLMDLAVSEARSVVIPADRVRVDEELQRLDLERRGAARRAISICDAVPELAGEPAIETLRRRCAGPKEGGGK